MRNIIIAVFFLFTAALQANELDSESYLLGLNIPEMDQCEKLNEIKGRLEVKENSFTFLTKDACGQPITLSGNITEKGIVMWLSGTESGCLVTFHYTGKKTVNKKNTVEGEVSIFQDHKRVVGGKWSLRPTE